MGSMGWGPGWVPPRAVSIARRLPRWRSGPGPKIVTEFFGPSKSRFGIRRSQSRTKWVKIWKVIFLRPILYGFAKKRALFALFSHFLKADLAYFTKNALKNSVFSHFFGIFLKILNLQSDFAVKRSTQSGHFWTLPSWRGLSKSGKNDPFLTLFWPFLPDPYNPILL